MGLDFYYDVIIDEEDYCNRKEEIEKITKMVNLGKKIVLYAPRRYGKSSLLKSIIGKNFQKHKKQISVYVNLMEVQSIEHISERILQSLRDVLSSKYPVKAAFSNIVESFRGLTVSMNIDPSTQLPSFDIKPIIEGDKKNLSQIFSVIKNISKKNKIFLILDEFQDISSVPEAAGLLRAELQLLKNMPIAILGSKKQMLNEMFSNNGSPFFNFGDELSLSTIAPEEWLIYFNKRLTHCKLTLEAMQYLCENLNHVPNAICEVGSALNDSKHIGEWKKALGIKEVSQVILKILSSKESSYRFQESLFTGNEQNLLRVMAKRNYLLKPTEHSVLNEAKVSSSAAIKIISRLTKKGWIEFEESMGYRISDPLFSCFLKSR